MIRHLEWKTRAAATCLAVLAASAVLRPDSAAANPKAPIIHADGQKGNGVWCIQNVFINCTGHDMPNDGEYGPTTRQAVIDIQRLFHLAEDGDVGPETGEAIRYVGNNCLLPWVGRAPYWDVILADKGCNNDVPTKN